MLDSKVRMWRTFRCRSSGSLQWIVSTWHNHQKVVYMDPHLKDILGVVPSTLKPLQLISIIAQCKWSLCLSHLKST